LRELRNGVPLKAFRHYPFDANDELARNEKFVPESDRWNFATSAATANRAARYTKKLRNVSSRDERSIANVTSTT